MTLRYFGFLGPSYQGSVVPKGQPGNGNLPHPQCPVKYASALQDLHFVLGKIGLDYRGFTERSIRKGGQLLGLAEPAENLD